MTDDTMNERQREQDRIVEAYARHVAANGVGPFYNWTGTPTAYAPPRGGND